METQEECPADLCDSTELLVRLVNTRPNADGRTELLGDRTSLVAWLSETGLADGDLPATDADSAAARELREAFVVLFHSHVGCEDAPVAEAEAYLRNVAQRYPLTPQLCARGCRLVSTQPGVPGALGALFAAAADVAARGSWSRLKVCKNQSCQSGFYDKTRNSAGLYCSAACNSLMSMRAYRSRLRNG